MQIQKWIASLAHLFFLILGLIGISLMYINGNFGLGLTGIGSVPYEDTAEFNTQFNNDLNDIFLYMEYQDVFGADSSIDLSRRMLKMTFGPSETENFSLSSLISYLESMGYQLDDDFNCQKVSEPADGVKSREGYVEWSVQEPQRIYSYRSASRKRSTLEDAAVEIMDTLHRYYTVYNRFVGARFGSERNNPVYKHRFPDTGKCQGIRALRVPAGQFRFLRHQHESDPAQQHFRTGIQ